VPGREPRAKADQSQSRGLRFKEELGVPRKGKMYATDARQESRAAVDHGVGGRWRGVG